MRFGRAALCADICVVLQIVIGVRVSLLEYLKKKARYPQEERLKNGIL